jgi:hypothetical protein
VDDPRVVVPLLFLAWVAGWHLVLVAAGYVLNLVLTIPRRARPWRGRATSALLGSWLGAIAGFAIGLSLAALWVVASRWLGLASRDAAAWLVLGAYLLGVAAGWRLGWRAGTTALHAAGHPKTAPLQLGSASANLAIL